MLIKFCFHYFSTNTSFLIVWNLLWDISNLSSSSFSSPNLSPSIVLPILMLRVTPEVFSSSLLLILLSRLCAPSHHCASNTILVTPCSPAVFLGGLFCAPCSAFFLCTYFTLTHIFVFCFLPWLSLRLKVPGGQGLSPDWNTKDFHFRSVTRETAGGWSSQGHFTHYKLWFCYPTIACKTTHVEMAPGFSWSVSLWKENRKYILFLTTFINCCLFSSIKGLGTHLLWPLKLFLGKMSTSNGE